MTGRSVLGAVALTMLVVPMVMTPTASAGQVTAAGSGPDRASKSRPTITVTLSPHARVRRDDTVSADVRVTGSKGAGKGDVDITGLPTGDCEALTLVHGRTSCETDALHVPLGAHTVTVIFHGDKHYRAARASSAVRVTRGRTELDLDTSPVSPAPSPTTVTLIARLVDRGGYSPASGTVRFFDGSGTFAGCARISSHNGVARCTTTLQPGSYTITSAFTGSKNFTPARSSSTYTVDKGAVRVSTSSLPDGVIGTPYSTSLAATGGTAPYTWKIFAGGLPTGLALGRTGVISGTPSAPGKWSVTVETTDANKTSALRAFTLRIPAPADTTR